MTLYGGTRRVCVSSAVSTSGAAVTPGSGEALFIAAGPVLQSFDKRGQPQCSVPGGGCQRNRPTVVGALEGELCSGGRVTAGPIGPMGLISPIGPMGPTFSPGF